MSELDAQTILNLTAVLAHNLLAAYDRRTALTDPDGTTLPVYEPQLAQQLVRALEPGVVAFVARLTDNLPPDFDAGPVLARFWADPAAAEALNQYGMDAPGGTRAAAEALLAAALAHADGQGCTGPAAGARTRPLALQRERAQWSEGERPVMIPR